MANPCIYALLSRDENLYRGAACFYVYAMYEEQEIGSEVGRHRIQEVKESMVLALTALLVAVLIVGATSTQYPEGGYSPAKICKVRTTAGDAHNRT